MRQVDVGTQSVKVLVYSLRTHGVVGRGQHEYELQNTRPGMAEQPPSVWEEGLQAALRDAMQSHDASEVRAVAVSGQQHGLVAMDASGKVRGLSPASLLRRVVLSGCLSRALCALNECDERTAAESLPRAGCSLECRATQVLRPAKLWCDVESAPQAARLSELFGWNIQPGFTATKLL
jgi:xylulokinase